MHFVFMRKMCGGKHRFLVAAFARTRTWRPAFHALASVATVLKRALACFRSAFFDKRNRIKKMRSILSSFPGSFRSANVRAAAANCPRIKKAHPKTTTRHPCRASKIRMGFDSKAAHPGRHPVCQWDRLPVLTDSLEKKRFCTLAIAVSIPAIHGIRAFTLTSNWWPQTECFRLRARRTTDGRIKLSSLHSLLLPTKSPASVPPISSFVPLLCEP